MYNGMRAHRAMRKGYKLYVMPPKNQAAKSARPCSSDAVGKKKKKKKKHNKKNRGQETPPCSRNKTTIILFVCSSS